MSRSPRHPRDCTRAGTTYCQCGLLGEAGCSWPLTRRPSSHVSLAEFAAAWAVLVSSEQAPRGYFEGFFAYDAGEYGENGEDRGLHCKGE